MISVKLLTVSGAWLHKRARDLAGRLIRLRGMKRVEVIDGYLITAKHLSGRAQAVVMDLPAVVVLSSRNRDGYGGALWMPYVELPTGRDALLVQTPANAPQLGWPFKALMPLQYTVAGDLPALDAYDSPLRGDNGVRYSGNTDRRLQGAGMLHVSVVGKIADTNIDEVVSKELRLELITPQVSRRSIDAAGTYTRAEGADLGARLSYALLVARAGLDTAPADVPFFSHWATAGAFSFQQGTVKAAIAASIAADKAQVTITNGMGGLDRVSVQQALWIGAVSFSREAAAFQGGLLSTGPATDGTPYSNRYCHNGGQWVVAGDKAYCLVSAAGAQVYRRNPGSADEDYAYPWTLTLYRTDANGAVVAQEVAQAPWWVPFTATNRNGYAMSDVAQCLVLGGCAVGEDVYFLTSNYPRTFDTDVVPYQIQLALWRVRAGTATRVRTFDNLRAAGIHYMLSRVNHVAWLGGSVIGFICGNTVGDDWHYSTWRVATYDVATGDFNLGAQIDLQGMLLRCDADALEGQALRYNDAGTGTVAGTQFAGTLDCLKTSADGYSSVLVATRGGLDCYNAINPFVGKTYISRDSGMTWSLLLDAGSGGAATYIGNALQPCALPQDART